MIRSQHPVIVLVCLLVILLTGAFAHVQLWQRETRGEDVYYSWVEGARLLKGENPYERILAGNMRDNDKYATYFPIFYELSALTQRAGLDEYEGWIAFWKVIFLAFDLAIAAALFLLLYPRGGLLASSFASAFWLFGRWTLHVTQVAHIDFIPIFLLIVSLGLFHRRRWLSLLLFSLSLSVKQIGIFLVPLYLIWTWQSANRAKFKQTLLAGLVIASAPVVASLPFLAWSAEGFIKSLTFSATRNPADHFGVMSLDGQLGWFGLPARLPLFAMLLAVYALAWRRKIGRYTASLFAMVAFVDFNAVLFRQYFAWITPLIPLVMVDLWEAADRSPGPPAATAPPPRAGSFPPDVTPTGF